MYTLIISIWHCFSQAPAPNIPILNQEIRVVQERIEGTQPSTTVWEGRLRPRRTKINYRV